MRSVTLRLVRTWLWPGEGGLTHDGQRLILSDGSSTLYFLDPDHSVKKEQST
jgi:glutamine cyclotransferase